MKKLLFITLLSPLFSTAQFSVDMGIGTSYYPQGIVLKQDVLDNPTAINRIFPVGTLSICYKVDQIVGELSGNTLITNQTNTPTFFGASLGYSINSFTPEFR